MPIIAKKGEGVFHLTPAGTFQAVCYNVWDLGLQAGTFNNQPKIQHKIIIGWEINETIESTDEFNGKRFVVTKKYTLSLDDRSNLSKDLTAWRGKAFTAEEAKGFDIEKLIGVNAMVNIVHNQSGDKTYANVAGVMKLAKGMMPMKPELDRTTPAWIQKLIDNQATPEEASGNGERDAEQAEADPEQDVPF